MTGPHRLEWDRPAPGDLWEHLDEGSRITDYKEGERLVRAEVLRRAAVLMREQHGPEHKRHVMWGAMATWLEATAVRCDLAVRSGNHSWRGSREALAVALAYLDETTSTEAQGQR